MNRERLMASIALALAVHAVAFLLLQLFLKLQQQEGHGMDGFRSIPDPCSCRWRSSRSCSAPASRPLFPRGLRRLPPKRRRRPGP